MAELKGVEYLKRKLNDKRRRVLLRYKYYDMKNYVPDFGIATPPQLQAMAWTLGWCGKAVDCIADRLVFKGFKNDLFGLSEIYDQNNPDILTRSASQAALIGSCSFIYIYVDDSGYPRMECIDGANATGMIDRVTGLLTEGYAVLERDTDGKPVTEAYFLPGRTEYAFTENRKMRTRVFTHDAPYPLLVPVINKADSTRPFGHSRISRACMDIMAAAVRTVKRSEISAEFYSFPQKWVTGLEEGAEKFDKWQATMASLLAFTKDNEGDSPTVGQFSQGAMTPHMDQLRMFASLFAGETGLTLDDLGFPSDNPSSADAIRSQHETLRLAARRAQADFGSGFLNAGFLAACLRDNYSYLRRQLYNTKPSWGPIFEPDAVQLSGIGDAVIKIQQAFPDYFTEEKLNELTGI
ncbi:MAG: phage portal protein [Lachnospiraceae bacterium]|nr:phage portal protein [Lachnospiraceae bacterium]